MESSWIRDQTHVPCIDRWILTHWATREVQIPSIFVCVKRYLFFLHFWRILGWLPFSFNTKYFTPLSSCLHISWREAQCIHSLCFSIDTMFSLSGYFKDFSLVFDFLKFEYDMIWYRFSGDFLFSSGWASLICGLMFIIDFGTLSVIVSSISSLPFFSFSPPCAILVTHMLHSL